MTGSPMSTYLSDLLTHTLDPGYAAAAARKDDGGHARTRRSAVIRWRGTHPWPR